MKIGSQWQISLKRICVEIDYHDSSMKSLVLAAFYTLVGCVSLAWAYDCSSDCNSACSACSDLPVVGRQCTPPEPVCFQACTAARITCGRPPQAPSIPLPNILGGLPPIPTPPFGLPPVNPFPVTCSSNCTAKCTVYYGGARFLEGSCFQACLTAKGGQCGIGATRKDEPIHGNYCGYGNRGYNRAPVDQLDAACRKHDLCYDQQHQASCYCDKTLASEAFFLTGSPILTQSAREKAGLIAAFFGSTPCIPP
jgi:hypothetical protein